MVDTLADWMLRFPALFHGLEVGGRFLYWAVLIVGPLWLAFLRGRSYDELWPAKSVGSWCWRIGWIVGAVLMAVCSLWPKHTNPPLWIFALFGLWACLFGYALLVGCRHSKAMQRQKQTPPE